MTAPTDQPTPTPETDAFFKTAYGNFPDPNSMLDAAFARRLERERDAAIAEREKLRVALETCLSAFCTKPPPMEDHKAHTDFCLRQVAAEEQARALLTLKP